MTEENTSAEIPKYAGLNKVTADQVIVISKWLMSVFILMQFVLVAGIYQGEKLIAKANGVSYQASDFLYSEAFIAVVVTSLLMVIYVFTRIFWYAVVIGVILFFEAIMDFLNTLNDGFSFSDFETFMDLAFVNSIMAFVAAFCMYAIKKLDKKTQKIGP